MDTKSKKSKTAFSFFCFLLSIIILTGYMVTGIYAAANYQSVKQRVADAFEPDYQNTYAFRQTFEVLLASMNSLLQNGGNHSYFDDINRDTAKNILYVAKRRQNGTAQQPAAFTNSAPGVNLNTGALPQGYNFRLYFDGKKVTITKDGKDINVYGDGFYRSGQGMWYVPGYSNLSVLDSNTEDNRITVLVRKEMVESPYGSSPFSYIPVEQRNTRILIYFGGAGLLVGIALFVLYLLTRRDKKKADLALARFSERFWFELKALGTAALVFLDFAFLSHTWNSNWMFWGLCVTVSAFCYYLVINDMRYNHMFYKHNSVNSALRHYRKLEQGKPFQKQMLLRFWALLAAEILLLLFGVFMVFINGINDFAGSIFVFGIFAGMVYLIYRYARRYGNTVKDIGLLIDQISLVKYGDTGTPFEIPQDADLEKAARELSEIRSGIHAAVEKQLKSERMKIDLITNVSHDIKTPLTSIIGYVDLLNQEDGLPNHVKDYIQVLTEKSDRLKTMVQDIFDISKATSGNMELKMEELDLGKLIRQTLADMNEKIEASGLAFKVSIPESTVMIYADGQRIYRVFQNLLDNALQYSLENSRVFLTLCSENRMAVATIKNTSKFDLDCRNDLTERFVRGDGSRSTSGSGLGLSIARSFTEACAGSFHIGIDADLFTAKIEFNQILLETVL